MKKLLLAAVAATAIASSADAALKKGDMAPDFTLNDINGVSHHLYDYLDQGYTVIIDESAAWCGPCWQVHQSHVFNDVMDQYGPTGTVQAKKLFVIYLEGETTNTTAQLHGPAANTGSYATTTQGDWVTGTKYPLIDNPPANIRNAYLDGGFPTFTVIGRDRIVYEQRAGASSAMLTVGYWAAFLTNNTAPNYPPSATTDAKVIARDITDAFICNASPRIRFQNYGAQAITSATVKVYSGTTAVSTQTWTGNLATYDTASVVMPGFTQAGPYKFEVTVANDALASNNSISNVNLAVITAAQAATIPYKQDFEGTSNYTMPSRFYSNNENVVYCYTGTGIVGANGASNTKFVLVDNPNNQSGSKAELLISNYNTASATNPALDFDVAYAQQTASNNDKIEIFASKDCGVTWGSIWSKSGATLKTGGPLSGTGWAPQAASDWRHESASLSNYKDPSVFIKIVATTNSGNFGFLDNFELKANATSVNDVIGGNTVSLYPNPARDMASLEFVSVKASNVTIQVVDMTGRTVANVVNNNFAAGAHKVDINTANLPSGIYNVKIQTEEGSRTERLTVVK